MKFMLTLTEPDHFERWAAMSDTERDAVFEAFRTYGAAVSERGEVLSGAGLARPEEAKTLSAGSNGSRTLTDGPFAEAAEQIGGFYLVDLPDLDAALSTAQLLPPAYTIEVRPVVDS